MIKSTERESEIKQHLTENINLMIVNSLGLAWEGLKYLTP